MLRYLLVPLVTLSLQLPAAGQADEASEIAAVKVAMGRLGQAFVSEDIAAIKSLMTADHIAIGPTYDGPVSIEEQIAMFPRIALSEWEATEKTVSLLAESVAMGRFGISIVGMLDGVALHSRAYATEIWVKRDGKWLQRLYQETALDPR